MCVSQTTDSRKSRPKFDNFHVFNKTVYSLSEIHTVILLSLLIHMLLQQVLPYLATHTLYHHITCSVKILYLTKILQHHVHYSMYATIRILKNVVIHPSAKQNAVCYKIYYESHPTDKRCSYVEFTQKVTTSCLLNTFLTKLGQHTITY